LTCIWSFIMLTVGVLLKSLTGDWPSLILTWCSAQSLTGVCPFSFLLLEFC
jgi:hypothetical protein